MKENEAYMSTILRVYPAHGEGAFLEIFKDVEGSVVIHAKTSDSETYFGKVDVRFEPEVADKIADAIKVLQKEGK